MKLRTEPATIKPITTGQDILKALRLADARICRLHSTIGGPLPARKGGDSSKGLFTYLSDGEKASFLAQCSERHVRHNSTIFFQGQKHTTFLIKDGLVRTFYVSPSGKEFTLAYWSEGDLIGGPYFFDDQRKNIWSAQAVGDCIVLAIEGAKLQRLVMRMPALASFVIDSLSFKLHWVSLLLQTLGTEFVYCRLAILLIRLSELYGEPCKEGIAIRHNFTQGDFAAMVGATRQWVSTALGRMQRDGIVRLHKRHLYILDRELLKAQTISS